MVMVLVGLVALPVSAGAQAEESEEAPKQAVDEEPAPSSEPAPEEPALQLRLDDAGVEVVPSAPPTVDGYTLEETQLRVKRARIGLLSSAGAFLVGIPFLVAAGNRGQGADFVPEQGADPVTDYEAYGRCLICRRCRGNDCQRHHAG